MDLGRRPDRGKSGCRRAFAAAVISGRYRASVISDEPPVARTLNDLQRQQARELIDRLHSQGLPDETCGEILDALEKLLVYPRVSDLLFWRTPDLTADEVIDEALRYRPFIGHSGVPEQSR
jgi:hypothetical protein